MVVGDREVRANEHFSRLQARCCSGSAPGSCARPPRPRCPTPPLASARTTARRRSRCSWSRASRTRSRRSSRRASCSWRPTTCPCAPTLRRASSRLFPSTWAYVRRNAIAIFRIYAQYEPLRVFWSLAALMFIAALGVWIRFVVAYAEGNGKRPRAIAHPRRRALHRRRRAVGARRDRRPARGAARDDAADIRACAADRAEAGRRALALRGPAAPSHGVGAKLAQRCRAGLRRAAGSAPRSRTLSAPPPSEALRR